jgi:hypothetical protein
MVAIQATKASKVRAFVLANPEASDREVADKLGIALSEVREHRQRAPKWKPKSVAPHLRASGRA